ncbi:hypothetical protein RHO31_10705, partial [Streptococcus pneumoniae]
VKANFEKSLDWFKFKNFVTDWFDIKDYKVFDIEPIRDEVLEFESVKANFEKSLDWFKFKNFVTDWFDIKIFLQLVSALRARWGVVVQFGDDFLV